MKTCRTCKLTKDIESFYQAETNTDGRNNQCSQCMGLKRNKPGNRFKHEDAVQPYIQRNLLINSLWPKSMAYNA